MADALTAAAVPTTRGAAAWRASTVRRVLSGYLLDQAVLDLDVSQKESA